MNHIIEALSNIRNKQKWQKKLMDSACAGTVGHTYSGRFCNRAAKLLCNAHISRNRLCLLDGHRDCGSITELRPVDSAQRFVGRGAEHGELQLTGPSCCVFVVQWCNQIPWRLSPDQI